VSVEGRSLAAVHGGLAGVLLLRPDVAARAMGASRGGKHPVLRLLGARHAVEAVALTSTNSPSAMKVAAGVDVLHGSTCLLLAAASKRERTPALRNAALAAVLASAAALVSRAHAPVRGG
jgi:hypothetical protein